MANKVSALLREFRSDESYWDAWLIGDFTEELSERMRQQKLSRSALAAKLGTSQAYITKILRGETNFTIRSMTRLAGAVDSVVRVHLAPVGSSTKFLDVIDTSGAEVDSLSQAQRVSFALGGTVPERVPVVVAVGAAPGGVFPPPAQRQG